MFSASTKTASGSPPAPTIDTQFNYVTMLLHGDGTNGAQNNTFLDSSSNNFTITRYGNTTQGSFSPYGSNWSNYFNGTDSWFTFTGTTLGSGSFTVEAWVNLPVLRNYQTIFDNRASSSSATGAAFSVDATGAPYVYTNDGFLLTSTQLISIGVWTHVAFVRNGTTLTIYVNGVSGGSTTLSATLSDTTGNSIAVTGVYTSTTKLNGYISNLRIVNGTAVYTSTFTPSTTPLTAITNTSLLTCQSNRFKDNSTNNFTLTVVGTPSVQRFNPFGTSTAYSTSVIGGSGYFDGSGDYLAISNGGGSALDMGTGNCTIEMWAYPDTQSTSFPSMFAPKTGWSSGTFYIRYQGSKFGIYWNGVGDPFFESTNTYPPNAWYHVALVRSGTTFTLYVNGVSAGTGTSSATLNLAIGGEVWLGNNTSASCYFKGLLSDVRVVKGTAVYTSTFTPPTTPLTAISGTSLLTSMTNGAIFDNAMMNDLETVGNAQISTSVKKYGTGSLAFDGTGDYLQTLSPFPKILQLGSANFTIESWIYANTVSSGGLTPIWNSGTNYGSVYAPFDLSQNDTLLKLFISTTGSNWNVVSNVTVGTIAASTWYHVALVRSGSTFYFFLNGVQQWTATNSGTFFVPNYPLRLAATSDAGTFWSGYIDDFRYTLGYARYTANFTPPTQAFLNTGPY